MQFLLPLALAPQLRSSCKNLCAIRQRVSVLAIKSPHCSLGVCRRKLVMLWLLFSTPAWLLVQTDSECSFCDYFVREEGIRWMNASEAGIAQQALISH